MTVKRKHGRKRGVTTFLDLGSGPEAKRGWKLAETRKNRKNPGKIISVDLNRRVLLDAKGRVIGQPHHLFKQADLFEVLAKQKANSVKVINDEGLIDQILMKHLRQTSKVGIKQPIESAKRTVRNYAKEVFRVLKQNGRFFITIKHGVINIVVPEFEKAGFKVLSVRDLTDHEISQGHSDYLKEEIAARNELLRSATTFIQTLPEQIRLLGFEENVTPKDIIKIVRISVKKPK